MSVPSKECSLSLEEQHTSGKSKGASYVGLTNPVLRGCTALSKRLLLPCSAHMSPEVVKCCFAEWEIM